jgi:hypothetical protein
LASSNVVQVVVFRADTSACHGVPDKSQANFVEKFMPQVTNASALVPTKDLPRNLKGVVIAPTGTHWC